MKSDKNPLSRILQRQVMECMEVQVDPAHLQRALEFRALRVEAGVRDAEEPGVEYLRPTPTHVRQVPAPARAQGLSGARFGYLTIPQRYLAMPALEHPRKPVVEAVCQCGAVVLRNLEQLRLCESLGAGCLGTECPHSSGSVRFWHNRVACLSLQHLAMLGSQQTLLPYRWGGPARNTPEDLEDVSEVACRRRFVEEINVFLLRNAELGRKEMWVESPSPRKNRWPATPNRLVYLRNPSDRVFPHRQLMVAYGGHTSEIRTLLQAMNINNVWEFMDSLNLMRHSFEESVDRFIASGDSKWT